MSMYRKASSIAVVTALSMAVSAAWALDYSSVTQERLNKPEPENWLMYRGNYAGWGYSPLEQINASNVKKLRPVWTLSTGQIEGHQAPPIVNNGVMFVATPMNQVMAIDAKSGDLLWRYQRKIPEELFQLHPTSRGVALLGDSVFLATTDAFLVALDAKTGKVQWETKVEDYAKGYYMTLAPLAAKGKVQIGVSGGEYGIRGFVAAYDAKTGKEAWKTYTIPGPGEPGHDSWPGDTWKTGGASTWITGTYDSDTNIAYWGTGNAAPWMPDNRAGDNLYANSVLALDADTGKLKGYHQYHHNEAWDWDEVSAPILMPVTRDGKTSKKLVHAARNGYMWTLDPKPDGKIGFVDAKPFVNQNVFAKVDPETGRPTYDKTKVPSIGKKTEFCPSLWGGKDWPPAAYSPKTDMLYVPAHENLCGSLIGKSEEYKPGQLYLTAAIADIGLHLKSKDVDHIGEVQAWKVGSHERVWTHNFKYHNWGPLLATGGDLIFGGGSNDRMFNAYDAKSGKVLWSMKTNSGVTAVPSSYSVNGKQYVAVQSGWGVDAQRMQDGLDAIYGSKTDVPQGGMIWVFALED